ncbi:hypothetical protein [Amycolatopsis aidingensis]|uniref:hypothetical protein n=1 Tax=Amycolatopsis aidingensis TaxID=2842453 RepID=UPI001C0C64D7|nr:hypothetical protein [Amycolatopsis aidingensis]
MGRLGRHFWWFAAVAGGGVALWGAWQFGALNWLWEENHPIRPVVEALSWVAGLAGLIVTATAVIISLRQRQGDYEVVNVSLTRPSASTAEKNMAEVRDSRGIQIGDHNAQTNHFDR